REFWMTLAQHFLYVWNLSLRTAVFPQCYKKANIYTLPKVKNAKETKHLRGISVTSLVARLFEKVVYRKWISENIFLRGDPFQFAYKRSLSTIDYLLTLQFLTLQNLDNRNVDCVHIVAVDFSMAFDGVNQEIAAQQYEKFIDSPFILKWLYDFTTDRTQRLIWKNEPCDYLSIDRGCAQGTVCGPSVFSMLTDDITSLHLNCHVLKYSDDMTSIVPCYKTPTDLEKKTLQEEVNHFCSLAKSKSLQINYEKTKQMRFCLSPNPNCKCLPLTQTLDEVSELRILGLLFQTNCLFTQHAKQLLSRLKSLLYLFKDLRLKCISKTERDKVFDALIVSRKRYGISVYACDKNAIKKVDNFLEKCFMKNYSSKRISAYDLLKIEDQRLMTNILANQQHPLRPFLLRHKKSRTTRHNFFGCKPKTNTKVFYRSFIIRILNL
ncbi:MAG: reverse transcriptase domain-containing protein, partial [Pseudomonadota bacterium]